MTHARSIALLALVVGAAACDLPHVPTLLDGALEASSPASDAAVTCTDAGTLARRSCVAASCAPLQRVTVGGASYWIDTEPVTVERFRTYDAGYDAPDDVCAFAGGGAARMDCVMIATARGFCEQEAADASLPTFRELEAAGRGGCIAPLVEWTEWATHDGGSGALRWPDGADLGSEYHGPRHGFRCVIRP